MNPDCLPDKGNDNYREGYDDAMEECLKIVQSKLYEGTHNAQLHDTGSLQKHYEELPSEIRGLKVSD